MKRPAMADEKAPPPEPKPPAVEPAGARIAAEHATALARLKLERLTAEREIAKLTQPLAAEEAAAARKAALARMKLERVKLERDLDTLSRPWWRSGRVAALALLIAVVPPATAAVAGYFDQSKQLALEERRQKHAVAVAERTQDDDARARALDPSADPETRGRALRLLAATSPDEKVRQWARAELARTDGGSQGSGGAHPRAE